MGGYNALRYKKRDITGIHFSVEFIKYEKETTLAKNNIYTMKNIN